MPTDNIDIYIPLLSIIHESNSIAGYVWLLNNSPYPALETKNILKNMKSDGMLSGEFASYSSLRLTPLGVTVLLQSRHENEQHRQNDAKLQAEKSANKAEQEKNLNKQFRHEWCVALASAALGSVLTLFIEHFEQVRVWITSLLH